MVEEKTSEIVTRVRHFFSERLHHAELRLSRTKAGLFLKRSLRLIYFSLKDASNRQLELRATSLVYTTLLSLVPLLAVSFSVLKAFGVHNQVEPLLNNMLAPLGPEASQITEKIIGSIERTKVGVLGSVGMVFLLLTVVSLIHKIEMAFNYIWHVKKSRSFARRFSDYLSMLLVGPILVFSAIGISASVMSTTIVQKLVSIEPFGTTIYFLGLFFPLMLVSLACTFAYVFLPNTKVKITAALAGGLFAGAVWEIIGRVFATFFVSSAKYAAIYSGLAILILFMIWVYLGWLILLTGAQVSFYFQYPRLLSTGGVLTLSGRIEEKLALIIVFFIARDFSSGKRHWTLDSLVDHLGIPAGPVLDVLNILQAKGLVVETGEDPPSYLPGRAAGKMAVKEVFDAVRTGVQEDFDEKVLSFVPEVNDIVRRSEKALEGSLGRETIGDMIAEENESRSLSDLG
ncbi:MAG: YihY/virulence factor BrkB family protein [Pseudomonadota bacterium]